MAQHSSEHNDPKRCDWKDCSGEGTYPAPRSAMENLREYYHFCLEHVRFYNKQWNFFTGMAAQEIERFQKESMSGHRPTWSMGVHSPIHDPLGLLDEIFGKTAKKKSPHSSDLLLKLSTEERDALSLFSLSLPFTEKALKQRYKQLVKRHHPDLPEGSEEKMKRINAAYAVLVKVVT